MKKRILAMIVIVQFAIIPKGFSQNVSINTTGTTADSSAILDISSSGKGVLIPRMTLAQKSGIVAPAEGLLVYQSNEMVGFYYYSALYGWMRLANSLDSWSTAGNAGTNAGGNFIGTTDNNSLSIKTNNIQRVFINGLEGSVGINTSEPTSTLDVKGSFSNTVTTAPGSITLTSAHHTVILTGTSSAVVTLPLAAGSTGRVYVLVNQTAAKNTLPDYQTFTIGVTTPVIAANSSITLQSDGISWNRTQ